ncbi:MAG: TonB-dependent receptor [Proteobacteria bacterium]|nr:TonB-dependent receptor [Pseudomonadota bacterium]
MFRKLIFVPAVLCLGFAAGAQAQDADSDDQASDAAATGRVLEEIVVTAQKREEGLTDVPISIVVTSGEKIRQAGIYRIEDLQNYVPNLQMTESGISTQMYIRGIGTGNNQGFEQSVGQYVDGIYYGRQQLIRAPMFDLARVSTLRGPQSILFGKNSIAGALSMTTAAPTQDYEGRFSYSNDFEHNTRMLELVMSGGLSDTVSGRFAIRKYDDDGYLVNTFNGADEPERDDLAVRGTVRWEPSDRLDITLKLERDVFDTTGRQIEVIEDNPAIAGSPIPGLTYAQILGVFGFPGAISDATQNYSRSADGGDFSNNELDSHALTINYQVGENTLTAVSGYVSYDFLEICDCDYTAAPVFNVLLDEEYEQFSQEIRLTSPGGEKVDWIVGGFYQTGDLDFRDAIIVPPNSVLGSLSPALVPILNTSAQRQFTQDSDLWAVFAQATINLNDEWAVTVGGRYTEEDKKGSRLIEIIDNTTGLVVPNFPGSIAPAVFTGAFAIENEQFTGHDLSGSRDESSFTPLVRLEYRPNDDVMLFASATTGFKAGGFDARSNNTVSFEFTDEEATSFEAGGRFSYADGRGETGISFFYTDYDDLQVSQFDGTLGFNVTNVPNTVVKGFELDGRYLISDSVTLTYAVGFLDHEFKNFGASGSGGGNCYFGETPVLADGTCDRTGQSGQYTPEFTGHTSLDYVTPFSNGWELRLTGDLTWVSSQNAHVNLDPAYKIDAYQKIDARVAISNEKWEFAFIGKNITDEKVLTYVNNVPLSGGTFGTNTYYGLDARDSTYTLQVTLSF